MVRPLHRHGPPRGLDDHASIYWVDAIAQQALTSHCIAEAAALLEEPEIEARHRKRHKTFCEKINNYYWDSEDKFYYDINIIPPYKHCRVKTPASYWPLLCDAANPQQAQCMHSHVISKNGFNSETPWPSVSVDDPDFNETGKYWRGGVWLPTAYMATLALKKYGYGETADNMAARIIHTIYRTWKEFEPANIWEAYAPFGTRTSDSKSCPVVRKISAAGQLLSLSICS